MDKKSQSPLRKLIKPVAAIALSFASMNLTYYDLESRRLGRISNDPQREAIYAFNEYGQTITEKILDNSFLIGRRLAIDNALGEYESRGADLAKARRIAKDNPDLRYDFP